VHAELCSGPQVIILWAGPPLMAWPMCSHEGIWIYTPTVPITTDLPPQTPKIGGDRQFGAGGDALAAVVNVQWGKLRCACVGGRVYTAWAVFSH
jgi:hypothetical protein